METASSYVKRGAVGTGDAQVLGTPQDSLTSYMRGASMRPDPKIAAEAKKNRDAKFDKYMEYMPEKIWEPLNQYQQETLNNYRDIVYQARINNIDPNNPDFQRTLQQKQDEMYFSVQEAEVMKGTYTEVENFAKSDEGKKYYKPGALVGKARDVLFNDDGSGVVPPGQVDVRKMQKELLSDPENMNIDNVASEVMDTFGEDTMTFYTQMNTDNDTIITETSEIKGKMFQIQKDENGNTIYQKNEETGEIIVDANGKKVPQYVTDPITMRPIPKVDDFTYPVFMRHPMMNKYVNTTVEQKLQQSGMEDTPQNRKRLGMEIIDEVIAKKADISVKKTASGNAKRNNYNWGFGIIGGMPREEAENWYDIIEGAYEGNPGDVGKFQDVVQDARVNVTDRAKFTPEQEKKLSQMSFTDINNPKTRIMTIQYDTKQYENVDIIPETRERYDKSTNSYITEIKDKNRNWRVNKIEIPIDGSESNKEAVMGTLLNYGNRIKIVNKNFTQVEMDKIRELRAKEGKSKLGTSRYQRPSSGQSENTPSDGGLFNYE